VSKVSKWIIGVLTISLVVVGFLLWKTSKDSDKLIADAAAKSYTNDSLKHSMALHDSVDKVRDAAVQLHDSLMDRKLDSVLHLLAVGRDSLKAVKKTLQRAVIDLGNQVSDLHDSILQKMYDSVKNTLNLIYEIGGNYINNSDSTVQMLMSEVAYKDSLYRSLHVEVTDLKKALTTCTLNFDGLKTDFDKQSANVKRQGLLAKIEIALASVAGALIGHSIK
jgi:predicted transcriptional regulator